MRKHITSVIIAIGICAQLASPARAAALAVVDRVVAIVNEDIITLSDLQREAALKKNEGVPDERTLLEDMINRKLQMTAAKRSGMDVTDKELADAMADIMKRNSLDAKQLEAALAKEGMTLDQYRSELREQMTMSRVFNKFVRAGLAVDEAEARAFYERNSRNYALPEEIRIRQILFPLSDTAASDQVASIKAKAEQVYDRAMKGEDFVRLVRENTKGSAGPADGDLGFIKREDVLPEIEAAVRTLKPGEIAGPLRSSGGFRIVRLEEVRTPVKRFESVKEEITNSLYQQKLENTYRSWLQTLRSDSHIENRL